MQIDISKIKFDSRGLVPAVVVDVRTNDVVMLAYMNEESLLKTLETGYTWFWSRSRQELWNKGATSGNLQKVVELFYDCDGDALLVKVEQQGVAGSYQRAVSPDFVQASSGGRRAEVFAERRPG